VHNPGSSAYCTTRPLLARSSNHPMWGNDLRVAITVSHPVGGTGTPQVPSMSYIWALQFSYSCRARKKTEPMWSNSPQTRHVCLRHFTHRYSSCIVSWDLAFLGCIPPSTPKPSVAHRTIMLHRAYRRGRARRSGSLSCYFPSDARKGEQSSGDVRVSTTASICWVSMPCHFCQLT
jgi:hypothetical protein